MMTNFVWLVWSNYTEDLDSVWTDKKSAEARVLELDPLHEWMVSQLPLNAPGDAKSAGGQDSTLGRFRSNR